MESHRPGRRCAVGVIGLFFVCGILHAAKPLDKNEISRSIAKVRVAGSGDQERAAEHLAELLYDVEPAAVDDKTIDELISLLATSPESARWVAASLGRLGQRANKAVPTLLRVLATTDCREEYPMHRSGPAIRLALTRIGAEPPPMPTCYPTWPPSVAKRQALIHDKLAVIRSASTDLARSEARQDLADLMYRIDPGEIDDRTVAELVSLSEYHALSTLGARAASAIPLLREQLAAIPSTPLCAWAEDTIRSTLIALGEASPRRCPAITSPSKHLPKRVRLSLLREAIPHAHTHYEAAGYVEELTRGLAPNDIDDELVRQMVALMRENANPSRIFVAVGNLGKRASVAIPYLLEALAEEECPVVLGGRTAEGQIRYALRQMGAEPPRRDCLSEVLKAPARWSKQELNQHLAQAISNVNTAPSASARRGALWKLYELGLLLYTNKVDLQSVEDSTISELVSLLDLPGAHKEMDHFFIRFGPRGSAAIPKLEKRLEEIECLAPRLEMREKSLREALQRMGRSPAARPCGPLKD